MQRLLTLETRGPGLYEFTRDLARFVAEQPKGAAPGLVTLLIRHTSASLVIQENADPEVQTDLAAFFHRLVPPTDDPSMSYLTHTYEGPDDMPAHIKAALLPTSLTIPLIDGRLGLGTWQGVYVFEHRTRPHRREVLVHLH